MPQARLPDINAAFTKHRNEVMASLKSLSYDSVFGSLYALNALLPETVDPDTKKPKYRVVISDIEYRELTRNKIFVICPNPKCNAELRFEEITMFELKLDFMDSQVFGKSTQKAWSCPKCFEINKADPSQFTETRLKEPFFLGVVPQPPKRQYGLQGRSRYHRKFVQWALTMLDELENKMALFRDDNWTKSEQLNADSENFDDAGEDQAPE